MLSVGHVSVRGLIQIDSLHLIKPNGQVERVGQSCYEFVHVSKSDAHNN